MASGVWFGVVAPEGPPAPWEMLGPLESPVGVSGSREAACSWRLGPGGGVRRSGKKLVGVSAFPGRKFQSHPAVPPARLIELHF